MDGRGAARIEHAALLRFGIEEPVVAAIHALLHRGLDPGQGLLKNRLGPGLSLIATPSKRFAPGGKTQFKGIGIRSERRQGTSRCNCTANNP